MSQTTDTRDANRRAARQIFDVWDGGDIEALDDVVAEDVVLHGPQQVLGTVHGRDAYEDNLRMLRTAFPDLSFDVHEVVAEDDTVMAHCTLGGTHEGELLGIEPTGRSVEVGWFGCYRFDDGRAVEVTSLPDLFGLQVQLGVAEPPGGTTREAENKTLVRRYPEEVISQGDLELIDELFADDYVEHNSAVPEPIRGPEGVREYVTMLRTAVPDIDCGVEELIAEGDLVVRRDRATGTVEGEFMGVDGRGRSAVVEGHHIHRIEDGQIVESWGQNDMLGLMRQLGAVDLPGE